MNRPASLSTILIALLLGACSTNIPAISSEQQPALDVAYDAASNDTVLLVSLEDGTVIKQLIDVDAEICFKLNSSSSTTCLTQGAPIVDPVTETLIGFEMVEQRIDLIAKTH